MSARGGGGGRNLMLASFLAVLSYVPFEFVAKATLLLCAFLFVVDPFPPISRLVSVISLLVLSFLARLYISHKEQAGETTDGGTSEGEVTQKKNE